MIRAHFGLDQNPFGRQGLTLLSQQQEIFNTLRVHCQQGGLCVVVGDAGTGKSIVKQALCEHDPKRMITPTGATRRSCDASRATLASRRTTGT